MRLRMVRHARTAWNVQKRAMGWCDEPIELAWQEAARQTAAALNSADVSAIVVSPVARARQTAAPLADLTGLVPIADARFGEIHVGPWEGFTEEEIGARWPDEWRRWRDTPHDTEVPGRETLSQLNARVAEALDELSAGSQPEASVVVFTHDAVIRAAVAWALGTGPQIYRHVQVDSCSITTFAVAPGVRRLVRSNDVAHLHGFDVDA